MIEPWTHKEDLEAGREYLVMASALPARRYGSTMALFRGARRVKRQLASADGLVGFALLARPTRRQYGSLSVWRDRAALDAFATSAPHGELMRSLGPHMAPTTFTTWTIDGADGRPTWSEAFDRLRAAAARS